jgi:hypothetical protein
MAFDTTSPLCDPRIKAKHKQTMESQAHRDAQSIRTKAICARPGYIERMRATGNEVVNRPGYREKMSVALKAICAEPAHKSKMSEASKEVYLRPGYKTTKQANVVSKIYRRAIAEGLILLSDTGLRSAYGKSSGPKTSTQNAALALLRLNQRWSSQQTSTKVK